MNTIARLEIPARAEYVGVVRLVVSSLADQLCDLDSDRVEDLKLAVSEACTNAIEAQGSSPTQRVVVVCLQDEQRFEVRIEDTGGGFDPTMLPPHPPPTDPARLDYERGLGIPLIRALVDDVEFTAADGGTRVRLVVECRPSAPVWALGSESAS